MMDHVETLETLKDDVIKLLVSDHEFLLEEAEEAVEESASNKHPDMWNENAVPEDLAKFLASDENED